MDLQQSSQLVAALRRSAHDLMGQRSINDLEQVLQTIVDSAVDTVPGADGGGITTTHRGEVGSRNPTDDDVRALDQLQGELREGPCVTAATRPAADGVVLADDLAVAPDSESWPSFAPRAVQRGYRSLMSTRLFTDDNPHRTALNLYSRTPGTFDESARLLAGLFGVQAALLLHGADRAGHLTSALASRDTIGQAKGILMERFDVDPDQAFQMLVQSSQHTNLKLADVASWLVTNRTVAVAPDRPLL